jgi:hypothetical protein
VRGSLAVTGMLAAVFALTACERRPEVDQVAQRSMIGLSAKKILACMGEPVRRDIVASTQIWTYPVGHMETGGAIWAVGLNLGAPPLGPIGACDVKLVFTRGNVTQVTYAALSGGDLPLGQLCIFPVENCVPTW